MIRDDGSEDDTIVILSEYIQRHSQKIILITDSLGRLGPKSSFCELLKLSKAPYIMFADQDDVWGINKIELAFKEMKVMESKYGSNFPLLTVSNCSFIDENGETSVTDVWRYLGINPQEAKCFRNAAFRTIFLGHSILVNRHLVDLALPIPDQAMMHDWWIGLVASAFGEIGCIGVQGVLYRQHKHNLYGWQKMGLIQFILKYKDPCKEYTSYQRRLLDQIQAFYDRFDEVLKNPSESRHDSKDIEDIRKFTVLNKMSFLEKKMFLFKFYRHFPYRQKALVDFLWY